MGATEYRAKATALLAKAERVHPLNMNTDARTPEDKARILAEAQTYAIFALIESLEAKP